MLPTLPPALRLSARCLPGARAVGLLLGTLAALVATPVTQAQPQMVAVGQNGTILTSPDGATWTSRVSGTSARLRGVTVKGATIIVVGQAGTVLTSADGVSWTTVTSGIAEGLRGVAASSTLVVAVGGQTTGQIFTSPDGATWTQASLAAPAGALRGVAHNGTQFAAVGAGGSILTSTDGTTWVARTSGTAERLDGIVWTGSAFEVISSTGKFLRSTDGGVNWSTPVAGNAPAWIEGMVWSSTRVVTVGAGGRIRTSDDGLNWTWRTSGAAVTLHGVAFTGGFSAQTLAAETFFGGLRKLTVKGLTAANKTYTGTTAAVISGTPTLDLTAGEDVSIGGTVSAGTFASAGVANGIVVTADLSGLTVGGIDAENYTGVASALTANITPALLTVTADNDTKVYGGVKSYPAAATAFTSSGLVNGETIGSVTLSASGGTAATDKVGPYDLTPSAATGGTFAAANYSISYVKGTLTVGPRAVTLAGTRAYDGTTGAAAAALSVTNAVGADLVSVASGSGVLASRNAGSRALTGTGTLALGNDPDGNYTLTGASGSVTITPVALTVTADAKNRAYGASNPTATHTLTGFVSGETEAGLRALAPAALSGTPTLTYAVTATAAAAANSTHAITAAVGTLTADNYTFTAGTDGVLTITAAPLTGTFTAAEKVYDGTLAATVTARNLTGVVGTDDVQLTGGTATFATKEKGTAKTVTLAGATLTGTKAANYTLSSVSTTTANITAKTVTVTGVTAANKAYDGTLTATPAFGAAALNGVISGDTATLVTSGATATFADKAVGNGKTVTLAGLSLTGGDAGNYSLTQPTTTANITAKALTVANARALDKIYDGSTVATLSFATAQLTGALPGETVTLVTTGATGAFADANAGEGKPVTVSGLSLGGADAAGYALTPPALTATISRRWVVFTLAGLEQAYNGTARRVTATAFPQVPFGIAYAAAGGGPALVTPVNAGRYTVTVTAADPNHTGQLTETLVITKARQTLTVTAPASATLAAPVAVAATASSGLPVTLAVSGPATLNQGQLTFQTPGTAVLTARQAGDANYEEASATASVTVAGKLAQTIAFAAPADQLANNPPVTLAATASSGLPVTYTLVSGPALLAGNRLTLRGDAGRVSVRAAQAGDSRYDPAPDVTVSFAVSAARVNVFLGQVASANPGASGPRVGEIGATLPPGTNRGSLLLVVPGLGLNRATDFQLNADGSFEDSFTADLPAAGREGLPATAGAPVTVRIRGTLVGGRLTGTIEPGGLSFDAPVLPVTGPSADAAGFYRSSTLAGTAGATYSVVGSNNQVLVLAATPAVTAGGLTTLGADGTFNLQAATAAGAATIRGTVDAPTTTVAGAINVAGQTTPFAGLLTTTARTDRLVNLSSRVRISGADGVLITGFVIGGERSKQLLIRGVGPALTGFGVSGALANPRLRVYRGATLVAENDDWSAEAGAAFGRVGAFSLPPGSRDAALVVNLEPGAYTAHVSDGGAAGVALAEIYDASPNPGAEYQRLLNISTRGEVTAGEGALIGGFVVTGNAPKRLLVRGVGPGLAAFGVSGVLADPRLRVFRQAELLGENDNWSTVPAEAAVTAGAARDAGAFALPPGSRDAAVILTLAPGAYTAQVTAADGSGTGTALIELYELP